MKDQGLLLIQDYRPYSPFADNLFENYLTDKEKARLFKLLEERATEQVIEEHQEQVLNSLSEKKSNKFKENKKS